MLNLIALKNFLKRYQALLFLLGIIIFVAFFSVSTLNTKPRLWIDEAVAIELAHNFGESGMLDVQVAPNKFSGFPYLVQSTGYPLTVILAGLFKVFGYSLTTVRVFMLLLMIVSLAGIFFLGKKIFGREGVLSVLLVAAFASFYGSGRTAVGEIPGFIFLLAGFYYWLDKKSYFWSGLFWGLAMVIKPSVFMTIAPVIFLVFILEGRGFFGKILKTTLGMIPAGVGWILLVLENPFLKSTWVDIFNFYKNPYGSASIGGNVISNLSGFFNSTTLVYFGVLFFIVVAARFMVEEQRLKAVYNFVIIYSVAMFVYYLRSPGWLRYILIAELLILFLLPFSLSAIFSRLSGVIQKFKISGGQLAVCIVVFLAIAQLIHLFNAAQIFESDADIGTAEYINSEFPGKSVGVINSLNVSILLEADRRFQTVELMGLPMLGSDRFLEDLSAEVIVFPGRERISSKENEVIDSQYVFYASVNGYEIYTLKH